MDDYWPVFAIFSAIAFLLFLMEHYKLMAAAFVAMFVCCNYVEFAHADELKSIPIERAAEALWRQHVQFELIEGDEALDIRMLFKRLNRTEGDGESYLTVHRSTGIALFPVVSGRVRL